MDWLGYKQKAVQLPLPACLVFGRVECRGVEPCVKAKHATLASQALSFLPLRSPAGIQVGCNSHSRYLNTKQ